MIVNNETIAEIVAEMRTLHFSLPYKIVCGFLDRIEAAAKREMSKNASKNGADFGQLGDAAAMRHAIAIAVGDLQSNLEMTPDERQFMARYLKAAIDKPARNCDKFQGDFKMLYTAWFDWTGSPSGHNADGTVKMTFSEWLLCRA